MADPAIPFHIIMKHKERTTQTQPHSIGSWTEVAHQLVSESISAAARADNEEALKHAIEKQLEAACRTLGIPWVPYQLERRLRGADQRTKFADAVHGKVVIEYEPPRSFRGSEGAELRKARDQAEDYVVRLAREEGNPITDYSMVAWDGNHISFGRVRETGPTWDRLISFDVAAAQRLLRLLSEKGRAVVSPRILDVVIGPESDVGALLLPRLFHAVCAAVAMGKISGSNKTKLLFTEWRRLFGQAVGIQTDKLAIFLERQSAAHGANYSEDIPAYLFSLHTYIAVAAKLTAALSLPEPSEDVRDVAVPLRDRLRAMESGKLFADAGITNMITGDFFSWYIDDASWSDIQPGLEAMLDSLGDIDFDLTSKTEDSVRDLFKGLYESFVPRELRHALGEFNTPDWLASHALDALGWEPENDLLDPTCGTGTFLIEALKRRLEAWPADTPAANLLRGLYGMDINPLAVLAAKASLLVVLRDKLDPTAPVTLPVFLADAINAARDAGGRFLTHTIPTEQGYKEFLIPKKFVQSPKFYPTFLALGRLIDLGMTRDQIVSTLGPEFDSLGLDPDERQAVSSTIQVLVDLHVQDWDGIWCAVLADRFAAATIGTVTHVVGNPPWVKWSHLPPDYAKFIKPLCLSMNVFSEDRYVGGIESDVSTVITFAAVDRWLRSDGKIGFFITGTVFNNESSQGFRRFEKADGSILAGFLAIEDFREIKPFNGVANHPTFFIAKKGIRTEYPITYTIWTRHIEHRSWKSAAEFRANSNPVRLLAAPVPGSDAGPLLKGTRSQMELWNRLFDAGAASYYTARKGVTTDLNGVYFVRVLDCDGDLVTIENDPTLGRTPGIPKVRRKIETTHLFPLLRGRELAAFEIRMQGLYVILPQRGMYGDPELPTTAPRTYEYLHRFEEQLRRRGSYRRYQFGKPFWSTWSTGPYTFAPYKVLWKEMSGHRFCAAYVGPVPDAPGGERPVVPDHKLYFVPVNSLDEARYLTALLNAPTVAKAISAYAAQLSLGTSVIEYLRIPRFDEREPAHLRLAELAERMTTEPTARVSLDLNKELDEVAWTVLTSGMPYHSLVDA